MNGLVSFHPLDLSLFDETLLPLVAGRKVNPEPFLDRALTLRKHWSLAHDHLLALEQMLEVNEPPRPEKGAGLLSNIKAQIQRLDHREDPLIAKLRATIEVELHLYGRPFLITEKSAARSAERVHEYVAAADAHAVESLIREQLIHVGKELAAAVEPVERPLSPELSYRSDLLAELKALYDIPHAARRDGNWGSSTGARRPAKQVLYAELPWRAVALHAKVLPFWVGRNVDGLETLCRAAGIEPPDCLVPAWRLFSEAIEEFPDLKNSLHLELQGERDVGAFVAPTDVERLLEFLGTQGARIIQVAARHDEGPRCSLLLKKIRECASFAARDGLGYLEATGVLPPDVGPEEWPEQEEPE